MKTSAVTMVRVYLTEADHKMSELLTCLHDEEKVQGVTVFRGITGFGKSGEMHSSSLIDMSLNLPIVIEFFDAPDKVKTILEHLSPNIEPGHIVTWSANINQ
ncbi:MAG: DUF190 domain-containing protein [Gammaproteobacteria bacterium]|nr:DUF190 domain-containing protein [Gammaproteobacteria bacterium]